MSLERGLIQVYTGQGKGKTTAALGLALRAAGQGLKVYIIQFMKGWPDYGELVSLEKLPDIALRQFGRPDFVDKDSPDPEDIRQAHQALDHARQVIQGGKYDIVILDEINVALDFELIGLAEVLSLLDARPEKVEFVSTLPKTRSGKIMRRVLKARALGISEGDLTTLEE